MAARQLSGRFFRLVNPLAGLKRGSSLCNADKTQKNDSQVVMSGDQNTQTRYLILFRSS